MQNKPYRKPQSLDGFISSRPRYGGSPTHPRLQPTRRVSQPVAHLRPKQGATQTRPSATPLSGTIKTGATLPASPIMARTQQRRRSNRRGDQSQPKWRTLTKRAALTLVALFLVSGGWMGWKFYHNTSKVFGNKNPLAVINAFKPIPLKGQATGHVNILLAGNSADRSDNEGGGSLTDSIMILSINTQTHAAYMLSVPRDLWVNIPGIGNSKINAANTASNFDQTGYPKGGMGMLEKVISDNFNIPIHYYALVNYTAFKDSVNKVGGIDVNIQSTDPRGLYDPSFRAYEGGPLKLPNGVNHLTGQLALNLARARGDPFNGVRGAYGFPQSDFDRTTHQRQMILALKEKAMSMTVLSNPLKIGGLMDAVGDNVHTDFQLNELASLYYMSKGIKSADIQSLSLNSAEGKNLLSNYNTPNGQSALIPATGAGDFSTIAAYINKTFNASAVTKEAAKVTVLNGGQTPGLAQVEGNALTQKGAVISAVGNAPSSRAKTTIIDNSGGKKPATKALLTKMFGKNYSTDAALTQQYPGDFIIILGDNQQSPDDASSTQSGNSAATASNI